MTGKWQTVIDRSLAGFGERNALTAGKKECRGGLPLRSALPQAGLVCETQKF